jgi:uncharacterized membrane protein YphA (DoxX/SURF4 family)
MDRKKIIQKIAAFLASYPVQFICRLILGGLFIYASLDKIVNYHAFARIIHNYKLVPDILIYIMAVTLPWVELISGLFLVSGIYKRTAAIILSGLLFVFITAITINLIRGLNFDCGCFSTTLTSEGSDPVGLLIRDILILVPGLVIIFFQPPPKHLNTKNR